jgi:dephospho-CoA kinase
MLKVGITGGIGSGKSTVAKIFGVLGIPVYNADTAARRLMQEDADLKKALTAAFGADLYDAAGAINRPYLADIVFNNMEALEKLNSLVHPVTIADAAAWMLQQTTPYTLKEAALIFESGAQRDLDCVIGVSAPLHLRLQRVMQRDDMSREQVKARMNKQLSESLKMKLCDYIIVNDEQQALIPQVLALHEQLTKRAGS